MWNGGTLIPNRINYIAGANYAADIASQLSIDFVLAATYQDSWDGTSIRQTPPLNYCHRQLTTLTTAAKISDNILTRYGLTGLTKCTYFIKADMGAGAPAFRVTKSDYYKY